ncbi:MAG: HPr kinase/phosphatase C-terminal domain-containing protein [Alphaproteobacteria bacterium]|nr:HPr kinase/phosphatase C-terminal domain-containing protein [Alphaproteobacteria bacterium]MCW5741438.1 HPr kinase/phosphatase C-terminal domain-containing protein [Alphaproteobacteria bacterium]
MHATCVALPEGGVLLRGGSGAGKSDLALRLIDGGARLVADDRTELTREGDRLIARAPSSIAGLIEARGVGILRLPPQRLAPQATVALIVDLVDPARIERLPEAATEDLLGIALPRVALAPFEASAPAKIRLALLASGSASSSP